MSEQTQGQQDAPAEHGTQSEEQAFSELGSAVDAWQSVAGNGLEEEEPEEQDDSEPEAKAEPKKEAKPKPKAKAKTEEATEEADGDDDEEPSADAKPTLAELAKQAMEKREQAKPKAEEPEWKAELEQAKAELKAEREKFEGEVKAFLRDPAEYFVKRGDDPSVVLDKLVKSGTDRKGMAIEQKLEQALDANKTLQERLERLEGGLTEREQQQAQLKQQEEHQQARAQFVRFVTSREAENPMLAGEDPSYIARRGAEIAQLLVDAGREWDYSTVADLIEADLVAKTESRATRIRRESPEQGEQRKPPAKKRAPSLTNAQAAQGSPDTEEIDDRELIKRASRELNAIFRSADQ